MADESDPKGGAVSSERPSERPGGGGRLAITLGVGIAGVVALGTLALSSFGSTREPAPTIAAASPTRAEAADEGAPYAAMPEAPSTEEEASEAVLAEPAEPDPMGAYGALPTSASADRVSDGLLAAPPREAARSAPATARASRRPAGGAGPGAPTLNGWSGSTGSGGGGQGRARAITTTPAAPIPAALPQNGVLSSTFVGGRGAQARLEDLLDRGVMVGGQNVRLEAFDELGRLPYPVPARDAVGLHAELERTRLSTGGERVHMQIALMARNGEAPPRPRMDVRLVFDRSGSMMGDKWTHGIAAAHALVDRLQPGDTFGLISYSDEASLDVRPARVGDARAAHRAIDALRPGGGTNIESALSLARANAPHRSAMNDVLLVMLVSDGVANIGQTNANELGRMARETFDASGALTTSVGLGTDFDEATMLAIAREGSGSYHFVRRASDIGEILGDELEERAQAVAQALRLRIELAPGVVARQVYGSQVLDEQQAQAVRRTEIATDQRLARELGISRDRQQDEDRGLRIHMPTFRRGDQHVVLMELEVPPGTRTTSIAHVSLDYKDLLARTNREASVDVTAERTSDAEAAVASTQRTVKRTVLAFQAGESLRAASEALSRGDVARAHQLLSEREHVLVAAADFWHDDSLRADANLLSRYDRVIGSAWNDWDSQSQRTLAMAMGYYGDRRMR